MNLPSNVLLSVITVNLNNANGLSRTIASIAPLLNDADVEFILIDGGSTDSSLELASSFYTSSLLISDNDRGIYDAMNKGASLASGTYLYWLNSGDEFIYSQWQLLKAELTNNHASGLACGVINFKPPDTFISVDMSNPALLPHSTLPHQGLFLRASVVRRLGGYNLNFAISADRDLILRILASGGSFSYSNLVVARFEEGGISSKYIKLYRDHYRVSLAHGLVSRRRYFALLARLYLVSFIRSISKFPRNALIA